ncbi:MAG: Xaa-Pro peptidase family protein [Gammaproteobacteria bacterium]|nr:Xaa-Pro peptidase family protein [Gammaproteobacteria bacterium]
MSKQDFLLEEFKHRHQRVRTRMAQNNLELLIVIAPTNIQYLIGSRTKSYQEFQCLLFPIEPDKPLTVLTRLAEVAEYTDLSLADEVYGWGGREPEDPIDILQDLMQPRDYLKRRIGLEVPYYYLSVPDHAKIQGMLGGTTVVDATRLIEDLKLVKSSAEIAYVRRAAEIANAAMQVAQNAMVEGATECEVAGAVYHTLLAQGGDSPASPLNLVSGDRSCFAHGAPTERALRRGDSINIEFGGAYKRYCTTIGRQFCIGQPDDRLLEVYEIVRGACDACIELMTPGTPAVVPHDVAKKIIADHGFDTNRVHTSGYGIAPGYPPSWGESIHMFGDSEYLLESGMNLSVEPPVFIHEERLGVRLIDNILITEDGPELLTSYNRDLIVL